MKPTPLPKETLVAVLRDMADCVEADDSFEGTITYTIPMPDDGDVPDDTYAMVYASYRIGNSLGQGGVSIVGAQD